MKDKNGKKVELAQTDDDSKVLQYEIFYKELRNNSVPTGGAFSFDKVRYLSFKKRKCQIHNVQHRL